MISINIANHHDPYERYKMPVIQCRKSNNKLIIENIDSISQSLNRTSILISHFYKIEYSTQVQYNVKTKSCEISKNDIITSDLQNKLNTFINIFVLCEECNNPETILKVNKEKEYIKQSCSACGHNIKKDLKKHKLLEQLVKHPEWI